MAMRNSLKVIGFAIALATVSTASFADQIATSGDLGFSAIQAGQWSQAESQLRQELVATPNDPMRLVNLAFVLQQQGRNSEAAAVYRQVLALNSNPIVAVGSQDNVKGVRVKSVASKGIARLETAKN
jgi:Flp pilus assembly protein TadD